MGANLISIDVLVVLAIALTFLYASSKSGLLPTLHSYKKRGLARILWQSREPQPPKLYKPWPAPSPEPSFEIASAAEHKFRPFRWGDYRLNMGIKPLDPQKWLELHTSYPSYAHLRATRHATYGDRCVRTLSHPNDANAFAALEVARAIAAFLSNRYPSLFQVEPKNSEKNVDGWNVRKVRRVAMPQYGLVEKTWKLFDLGNQDGDDPMKVAGELTPDDLAILREEPLTEKERSSYPGGLEKAPLKAHRLVAGSICTAGFWRLEDKIGLCLREIHTSGKVPHFEEKLMNPMDRFFSKMTADKPVERIDNFFFQVVSSSQKDSITRIRDGSLVPDILSPSSKLYSSIGGPDSTSDCKELHDPSELSWSWSTNGPETLFDQVEKGPKADGVMEPPNPTNDPDCVVMRAERQTLRRMPRSGAILFTIRTYLTPVSQMAEEPGVPGRLASAIRNWPTETARYKGSDLYTEAVLPYLDAKHEEQVDNGVIAELDIEKERSKKAFPM